MRDAILELNVILITLDNEDDAYLIFETLNTRGKDLALSDLVRNLFARNLRAKGDVDHAKLKWDRVLETIDNSSEELEPDNFIVHSWQSRFDAVTKAKAYQKIREEITSKTAKRHLDDFIFDVDCYRSIFEPSFSWKAKEAAIKNSLEAYKLFKLVQPTPAILALVRAYRMDKLKLRKLRATLLAIENFHFMFTAVTSSRSSGGISSMYSSFGRKLFEAKDSNEASIEIRFLINKLKERIPAPSEFDATFEQIIFTREAASQRALVRYVLLKTMKHERLPIVGPVDELTIEHLIPQKQVGKKFPEETVGMLGNLILVDPETNGKLGAKSFSEKKEILTENGYRIPTDFEGRSRLTGDAIRARTAKMAKSARESIWKVA